MFLYQRRRRRQRTTGTNSPPNTPTISAGTPTSSGVTLTGSAFSDSDVGDTHAASQWQVTTSADTGYASPVISTGDDAVNLTSYAATGLSASTDYIARVRYKDSAGNYSSYATSASFTTAAATQYSESWADLSAYGAPTTTGTASLAASGGKLHFAATASSSNAFLLQTTGHTLTSSRLVIGPISHVTGGGNQNQYIGIINGSGAGWQTWFESQFTTLHGGTVTGATSSASGTFTQSGGNVTNAGVYLAFHTDGTNVIIEYSADGSTWSTLATMAIGAGSVTGLHLHFALKNASNVTASADIGPITWP